ncbi:hypothetical protein ACTFIY_006299 [Dictyostelium cf. discoideum]
MIIKPKKNTTKKKKSSSIECLSNLYISKKSKSKTTTTTTTASSGEFLLDLEKRQFIIKNLVSLLNNSDNSLRHKSLESLSLDPSILNIYVIPKLFLKLDLKFE